MIGLSRTVAHVSNIYPNLLVLGLIISVNGSGQNDSQKDGDWRANRRVLVIV